MSSRLDLPLAAVAWIAGFAWVRLQGSWTPLAVLAALCALRLVAGDATTRRLLVPRASAAPLALVGAAAMIASTYALYAWGASAFPSLRGATAALYDVLNAEGYRKIALGALVVTISACEEIVWRGRPLEQAATHARPRPLTSAAAAQIASVALLYGASHLSSGSLLLGAIATACGLAWGLLRVLGGSLWPSMLVHAAWDLAVLVAHPLT
jgi:membrane protease YdiL (CAAX protease family)